MTVTYRALGQAGRLGNQLWEIASTLGIADKRGEDASFPPDWEYQPFFNIPAELFTNAPGIDATEYVPHLDPRAKPYLQDYGLWAPIANRIKEWFQPSSAALATIMRPELDWFWALDNRLAVHIRRGDNVTHPPGFHPLRSLDYYARAAATLPDAQVVVFSDDIAWCREHVPWALARDCLFYEGVTRPREYVDRKAYKDSAVLDWVDLFLMRACEHHVISNSTYAWWGAYLSTDPHPIYPSNWFGWKLSEYTDASLMFPPGWHEMQDLTQGGATR